MKKEKKVVTVYPIPDLPVGTLFVFAGKKQQYEVTPREDNINCCGCVFDWSKFERGSKERKDSCFKCTSFRCYGDDRKDGQDVKAVKVRSSRRGKEV